MRLKKYTLAALLAVSVSFSSCNDWLDIVPENTQTTDQYWQTGDEVEAVLGAGYYYLRNSWSMMYFWGEARGNGMMVGSLTKDDAATFNKLRELDILPSNAYAKWEKMYQIIGMANSVIKYAPDVVARDDSFNENIMRSLCAEAYWLRSYAYFTLIRTFRDVPLVLEPYVTDEAEYTMAKSGENEILQQLISDLENCREYAKEYFPTVEDSKGRATRWAIDALLADIYLWRGNHGDYDMCIEHCNNVINSGRVGLIDGSKWFENFYPGNSNESIYEIQYSNPLSQTNSFLSIFATNLSFVISSYSYLLFEEGDQRGLGHTIKTENVLTNWKFIGKDDMNSRISTENDQNWIIYRIAEMYLMKAEAQVMKGDLVAGTETLNVIRTRAGVTNHETPDNELAALQLILRERQREFVSEGKSWYDILRIGKRHNFENKELLINQVLMVTSASQSGIVRAKLSDPDAYYMPIHSDELKSNNLLVQNPYYESFGN